jgi:hypothetical protein
LPSHTRYEILFPTRRKAKSPKYSENTVSHTVRVVIKGVLLAAVSAVIALVVIGLVVALQMYLASSPKWQIVWQIGLARVVVVVVGAVVVLLLLSFAPDRDTREPREQDDAPKRYDPSIRVFIVFFAAVLGFGLKHLLDLDIKKDVPYKWLFFLVATFIFLRFLTAAQNNLWLEYLKYGRVYSRQDDFYVGVGFFWITVFGCLGAFLCYAETPQAFFKRACILLSVTLLGSAIQWLWAILGRTDPKGEWGWWFSLVNGTQLTAVLGFWGIGAWWGWTWGLCFLAAANLAILVADFSWQLKQVAK